MYRNTRDMAPVKEICQFLNIELLIKFQGQFKLRVGKSFIIILHGGQNIVSKFHTVLLSFPLFFLRSLYLFVLRPAILLKFTKAKLVANKIISFDLISDASHDQTAKLRFFGTTAPPIPWEPSFCVLREDVKTLTFHKQEEVSSTSLCSFIM